MPLLYYVARHDPHDERFAWRMFSTVRMDRCGTHLDRATGDPPAFFINDNTAPVELAAVFHEAWIQIAQRGRKAVIEAMAAELCDRHPGASVRVKYGCRSLNGRRTSMSDATWNLCRTKRL